jgi:hypothetical protein
LTINFVKTENYSKSFSFYQRGFFGVDNIGRPIFVEKIGSIDVDKCLNLVSEDEFWIYIYYHYETLLKHKFLSCSALYDR